MKELEQILKEFIINMNKTIMWKIQNNIKLNNYEIEYLNKLSRNKAIKEKIEQYKKEKGE